MNDHNNSIELETAITTTTMTMIQALRSAMDVMLERDDNVVVFGQDVGYFGGVFRCTEGSGTEQVRQLAGVRRHRSPNAAPPRAWPWAWALTACARWLKSSSPTEPSTQATDQIISKAARLRYRSAGQFTAPLTRPHRLAAGIYAGQYPQPEYRSGVHPRSRPAHGDAVQPLRRQGPVDRLHRKR